MYFWSWFQEFQLHTVKAIYNRTRACRFKSLIWNSTFSISKVLILIIIHLDSCIFKLMILSLLLLIWSVQLTELKSYILNVQFDSIDSSHYLLRFMHSNDSITALIVVCGVSSGSLDGDSTCTGNAMMNQSRKPFMPVVALFIVCFVSIGLFVLSSTW